MGSLEGSGASAECSAFVFQLLRHNPAERGSHKALAEHPWVTGGDSVQPKQEPPLEWFADSVARGSDTGSAGSDWQVISLEEDAAARLDAACIGLRHHHVKGIGCWSELSHVVLTDPNEDSVREKQPPPTPPPPEPQAPPGQVPVTRRKLMCLEMAVAIRSHTVQRLLSEDESTKGDHSNNERSRTFDELCLDLLRQQKSHASKS